MIWIAMILPAVVCLGILIWLWRSKPLVFRAIYVNDVPDSLQKQVIYIAGETGHFWSVSMLCPCGCGDMIQLNLLQQVRPCWQVQTHPDQMISITPSVWRQQGCKSHFWIRHGRIDWY